MPVFVDTNVLVYDRDTTHASKHSRAQAWVRALWESRSGRLSYQVLHEYYVTVTRKLDAPLRPDRAREQVRRYLQWDPIAIDGPVLEGAWRIEERFRLSFWDALIVAAAGASGSAHLLTEDLQDGQDLDGVIVVDPFLNEPGSIL